MKKVFGLFVSLVLISLLLLAPASAKATADVYYDLGSDVKLYIIAEVCKVPNCVTAGIPTDWYNYSTTSENVDGNSGAGQTLVVRPGDKLTFLGATRVVGQALLDPIYGISFVNDSYLTIDHLFSDELDDVDGDGNVFQYADNNNIGLSDDLTGEMDAQVGAITATVNSNAPDGAVITGTFFVDSAQRAPSYKFGTQRALAGTQRGDNFVRSEVRLLVSNPAPVAASVVLPVTGADGQSKLPYLLLSISIILAFGMTYFLKRAKR